MNAALNNCSLTDPEQLQYIGHIVNQVLDERHELGSLQNFQSALKELSLLQGREIQMNFVNHDNQLVGFNFVKDKVCGVLRMVDTVGAWNSAREQLLWLWKILSENHIRLTKKGFLSVKNFGTHKFVPG
ncbi:hypothetical protein ACE1CI_22305 [Aerosakkonemataceae cyanobacterium BLCC-F50]|uniref:Uncharacterized protein n=1 Tax=Floridaenema flaviceps BLCC-F50 TaxID=3153642 RepID=A0ABV4XV90_9CYAN